MEPFLKAILHTIMRLCLNMNRVVISLTFLPVGSCLQPQNTLLLITEILFNNNTQIYILVVYENDHLNLSMQKVTEC